MNRLGHVKIKHTYADTQKMKRRYKKDDLSDDDSDNSGGSFSDKDEDSDEDDKSNHVSKKSMKKHKEMTDADADAEPQSKKSAIKHRNKDLKDLKYLQNPELLAKKHNVRFEDSDANDQEQCDLPPMPMIQGSISSATAKRLNESVNLMIQTINNGNKKQKVHPDNNNHNSNNRMINKHKNTSILPAKLKSICSANLNQNRLSSINTNAESVERVRRKDIIYNLMTNNTPDGLRLLDTYVTLIYQTLLKNNLYPNGPRHADDAKLWDDGIKFIIETKAPQTKRAFVWATLYICPYIVDIFCPRENSSRFLTDPEKLAFFIKDKSSPLTVIFSDLVIPTGTAITGAPSMDIETFAALATFEWIKLLPWEHMDRYTSTPPTQTSKELRLTFQPETVTATERRALSPYMNVNSSASSNQITEYDAGNHYHDHQYTSIEDVAD